MEDNIQTEQNKSGTVLNIIKDFSIPFSIIIAGIFIGAGLYFGNGAASPREAQNLQVTGGEEEANTAAVREVTAEDHIKGDLNAPVKIVEYSDFDCPFCSRFHETMNQIVKSRDDVAWVYRHFPLEQLHPNAPEVALASECVAKEGGDEAFWNFADAYFAARGSGDATEHSLLVNRLALEAGVDQESFNNCLDNQETASLVEEDLNNAVETGGRGTPWSIIIGPSGKTYPVNGALPAATVEQIIELALEEA